MAFEEVMVGNRVYLYPIEDEKQATICTKTKIQDQKTKRQKEFLGTDEAFFANYGTIGDIVDWHPLFTFASEARSAGGWNVYRGRLVNYCKTYGPAVVAKAIHEIKHLKKWATNPGGLLAEDLKRYGESLGSGNNQMKNSIETHPYNTPKTNACHSSTLDRLRHCCRLLGKVVHQGRELRLNIAVSPPAPDVDGGKIVFHRAAERIMEKHVAVAVDEDRVPKLDLPRQRVFHLPLGKRHLSRGQLEGGHTGKRRTAKENGLDHRFPDDLDVSCKRGIIQDFVNESGHDGNRPAPIRHRLNHAHAAEQYQAAEAVPDEGQSCDFGSGADFSGDLTEDDLTNILPHLLGEVILENVIAIIGQDAPEDRRSRVKRRGARSYKSRNLASNKAIKISLIRSVKDSTVSLAIHTIRLLLHMFQGVNLIKGRGGKIANTVDKRYKLHSASLSALLSNFINRCRKPLVFNGSYSSLLRVSLISPSAIKDWFIYACRTTRNSS